MAARAPVARAELVGLVPATDNMPSGTAYHPGDVVDTYAGPAKVFVFIDDLDRCEVPKAAELLQVILRDLQPPCGVQHHQLFEHFIHVRALGRGVCAVGRRHLAHRLAGQLAVPNGHDALNMPGDPGLSNLLLPEGTYYLFAGGDPRSLVLGENLSVRMNSARVLRLSEAVRGGSRYQITAVIPALASAGGVPTKLRLQRI